MKAKIKFGTDGWRAIMGEDYTPENITRVIQAFCDLNQNSNEKRIYVGFDRRRDSDQFAKLVAQILADNGFTAFLSSQFCPTPCVSWLVKTNQALAGIMVTASHNPPKWNGIKFKESYGGAASPEYTGKIEAQIEKNDSTPARSYVGFDELVKQERIRFFDPKTTYVEHLRKFIDVQKINESGLKIAVDPLFGAGTNFISEVLQKPVLQLHGETDPNFGGLNPEPIEKNLKPFWQFMHDNKSDLGLATDGDADRIGAISDTGEFITSQQIFALLLKHHVTYRKLSGAIVMSVSTTSWIPKMCAKYGLQAIETPIGFKFISQELLKNNALMGGEESGGLSLREHVHERDGVLNGLLLAEMCAVHGKKLSGLLQDLYAEFGHYHYHRHDYHLTPEKIAEVKTKLAQKDITECGGHKVVRYNTLDGTRIYFADDSWLLVRASGTEPLLRVYSEALSRERVEEILAFAKSYFAL